MANSFTISRAGSGKNIFQGSSLCNKCKPIKDRNSNLISLAWTALKKHQLTGESIQQLTVLAAGRGTCPLFLSHKKWKMFCRMKQTECNVIIWRKKTLMCQWRAQKRNKTRIHSYSTSNFLSSLPCGKGFSHFIL